MNPYQPGEDNQDPYEVGYKAGAASLDAEVAELKKEVEEDSALRERLAKILAEVAIALKGQEPALTRHSWHDLAQCAIDVVKERDQLREQLASRDAEVANLKAEVSDLSHIAALYLGEKNKLREQVTLLRDALEVTHELYANTSSGYGFARPENPHNFHCDIDCCSKEEIEAHSKACDDYAAGRKVSNDSWGIGTYCDEYAPAIKALAATEPKP